MQRTVGAVLGLCVMLLTASPVASGDRFVMGEGMTSCGAWTLDRNNPTAA
jgi:hypothetical protein